jgi:hypothetical protein
MKKQSDCEKRLNAANRLQNFWESSDGNMFRFELHDAVLTIDVVARIVTYYWGDRAIPKTKRSSALAVVLATKFATEMRRKVKATAECPTMENWKNFS